MKTVEEVLKENPGIHLWKDKLTLDLTLTIETKSFLEELRETTCARCEAILLPPTSPRLREITGTVTGIHVSCKTSLCRQSWYLHTPIVLPKSLSNS